MLISLKLACVRAEMFVEGPLKFQEAADVVSKCMEDFAEAAETLPEATGTLVLRIFVTAGGTVDSVSFLTDTLVPRPWECHPDLAEQEQRRSRRRTKWQPQDDDDGESRNRWRVAGSGGRGGSAYDSAGSGGSGFDSFDSLDGSDVDSSGRSFDSMDSRGSSVEDTQSEDEGMYSDDDPIEYIDGSGTDRYSSGESVYSSDESMYSEDEDMGNSDSCLLYTSPSPRD